MTNNDFTPQPPAGQNPGQQPGDVPPFNPQQPGGVPPFNPQQPGQPPLGAPQASGFAFAVPGNPSTGLPAKLLWGAIGAAGVMFLSTFLPWASVLGISVSGIQSDGVLVVLLALLAAGFAFTRIGSAPTKIKTIGLTVTGGLASVLTLIVLIRISSGGSGEVLGTKITASPGIGLILGLLASLAVTAIGVYALTKKTEL